MAITILKQLRIKIMNVLASPTHVIVTDAEGNIGKADISGFGGGGFGNIEGGSSNTVYLASQNIEGGSSVAVTNGIIDGGNANN